MALLETRDLAIRFGGIQALGGVSFAVERGEILAIIGPNGAGKTTIFNLISRIYDPTAGRLYFEDREITRTPAHRIAGLGIARTFQNIELFENASVLENLLLGRHAHRRTGLLAEMVFTPAVRRGEIESRARVEEIVERLELEHHRDSPIGGLPYGVRKVVELGRALACAPKLLLLDEPSSGLSVEETQDMAFWITDIRDDLGISVLMVEHDMTLVGAVADSVLALDEGTVLARGSPAQVQDNPDVIRAYLGS